MTHSQRSEGITERIATLIQQGHINGQTSYDVAQRITVLIHLYAAEQAGALRLVWLDRSI